MDGGGGYRLPFRYTPNRQLSVQFDPAAHNRVPHPDVHREEEIDIVWGRNTSANPKLFNASKFRLASYAADSKTCTLHLGLTDYKSFQGTHAPPNPLRRYGKLHMSLPLGNVVVPVTKDGRTILLVRNSTVGEGHGKVVFPGGHPEPSEVKPPLRTNARNMCESVLHELWDGARRELLEELFLEHQHIDPIADMSFLGLVERGADAKTSMVFSANVFLTADEIVARYTAANGDQEETVRIIVVDRERLSEVYASGELEPGVTAMPETLGAAELWFEMIQHL